MKSYRADYVTNWDASLKPDHKASFRTSTRLQFNWSNQCLPCRLKWYTPVLALKLLFKEIFFEAKSSGLRRRFPYLSLILVRRHIFHKGPVGWLHLGQLWSSRQRRKPSNIQNRWSCKKRGTTRYVCALQSYTSYYTRIQTDCKLQLLLHLHWAINKTWRVREPRWSPCRTTCPYNKGCWLNYDPSERYAYQLHCRRRQDTRRLGAKVSAQRGSWEW